MFVPNSVLMNIKRIIVKVLLSFFFVFCFLLYGTGCGPGFQSSFDSGIKYSFDHEQAKDPVIEDPSDSEKKDESNQDQPSVPPKDEENSQEESNHDENDIEPENPQWVRLYELEKEMELCTSLSLEGILWKDDFRPRNELKAFIVALNLSGSFEGKNGWRNLTNNFDEQGMSAGLMNQCLGQGSLQPLFIEMNSRYPEMLKKYFSVSHWNSFYDMFSGWQSLTKFKVSAHLDPEFISAYDLRPLSIEPYSMSAHQESVLWAKNTIYNGSSFKSDWKQSFLDLLGSPEYIILQLEAAQVIHQKALTYMNKINMNSFRSYLMMFDIIVQNGGIYNKDFEDYFKLNLNELSETERLYQLLLLRVRHSASQWKQDVIDRKSAIIYGSGLVHEINRNFPQEYCFDLNEELND